MRYWYVIFFLNVLLWQNDESGIATVRIQIIETNGVAPPHIQRWILQPAKTDSGKKPTTKLSDFDAMYGCSKYKWCQTGCKDCNPAKTFRWVSHQADEPTLHQGWIWYMVDGTAGAAMPMFRNCLGQSAAEGEIYKVEREVVTGEIPY